MQSEEERIALVRGVRSGDRTAFERLYESYHGQLKFWLMRHRIPEYEDHAHDAIISAVEAIRKNALRDPRCLPSYVRGIARNMSRDAVNRIAVRRRVQSDRDSKERRVVLESVPSSEPNALQHILERERRERLRIVLNTLSAAGREIIERFYLYEQSAQQIRDEMGLTQTQFRLLKSKSKALLTKAVQQWDSDTAISLRVRGCPALLRRMRRTRGRPAS